jgi:SAM-dependent methyltransferase
METRKSFKRRTDSGFFKKYLCGNGIDIGCGNDKVFQDADAYDNVHHDKNDDAQTMKNVPDEKYDWVYSSHCLEHLKDPCVALKNWFRILKKGGNLAVAVPHRDLYEKRERPPSKWNTQHANFFVVGRHKFDNVLGVIQLLEESLDDYELVYLRVCDDGHTIRNPLIHSDGEFQIEFVVRKGERIY